ncbi:hypothetical protein PM10SUCC1_31500 [Propionigenium maris DSM 9537]|uniref:Uncharacterized protein n=1 Tax=Propionigenium maris DSM 9537 TaxID=1123000 RepID=A0A9W6GPN1_9FUSO|nr:hypothetical protein [Propionigenium maris]GLI57636.1 hypothetical protein PM10SUCC1_31500 [Propionigenium maris DSM 9537]
MKKILALLTVVFTLVLGRVTYAHEGCQHHKNHHHGNHWCKKHRCEHHKKKKHKECRKKHRKCEKNHKHRDTCIVVSRRRSITINF